MANDAPIRAVEVALLAADADPAVEAPRRPQADRQFGPAVEPRTISFDPQLEVVANGGVAGDHPPDAALDPQPELSHAVRRMDPFDELECSTNLGRSRLVS